MAKASTSEESVLRACRISIGIIGFLLAFLLIGLATGVGFWIGVAWLACGLACTPIIFALHRRIEVEFTFTDWLALNGYGAIGIMLVIILAFDD